MPPKTSASTAPRGRPPTKSTSATATSRKAAENSRQHTHHPPPDDPEPEPIIAAPAENDEDDDTDQQKSIPPELLTRVLHDFFEKDSTRISRDANAAVAKYMDIFVREAIVRAAAEKDGGFLEVEDLEKIAPQLLLDL